MSNTDTGINPPSFYKLSQLFNAFLAAISLILTRLIKKPVVLANPVMLMVEPTTACQLKCPHCPTGRGELSRPAGTMKFESFIQIWDSIKPAPMLLQLWNQGEPLVSKHTPDIIRHATLSGAKVKMSTNVELLADYQKAEEIVKSGLNELILSLDGTSEETYSQYRKGGSFEKVKEGVANILKAKQLLRKKFPIITWQFLLFKHTLAEVAEAKKLAEEWKVDRIVFKTAQLEDLSLEEGQKWLPDNPSLRRYELKNDKWVLKRNPDYFCNRIYASAVLQWDGTVVPCCFDKDGEFIMGDASGGQFPEVWRSAKFNQFRQDWINGERPAMCGNCTEGLKSIYSSPRGI